MVAEVEAVLELGTGTVGQAPPGSTFCKPCIIRIVLMIANIILRAYYVPHNVTNTLREVSPKSQEVGTVIISISQMRSLVICLVSRRNQMTKAGVRLRSV